MPMRRSKALEEEVRAECIRRYEARGQAFTPAIGRLLAYAEPAREAHAIGRALEDSARDRWRQLTRSLDAVEAFVDENRAAIEADGGFEASGLVRFRERTLADVRKEIDNARSSGVAMGVVAGHSKPPSRATFLRDRLPVHFIGRTTADVVAVQPSDLAVLSLLAGFWPPGGAETAPKVIQDEADEIRKAIDSLSEMGTTPKTGG